MGKNSNDLVYFLSEDVIQNVEIYLILLQYL